MPCHPSELCVHDILSMNRAGLIGCLLEFNRHSALRFDGSRLRMLSNAALRRTLMDVRRHYQARGY